ncbi:uncharacterized protein LOC125811352 [Solanum verrucosum]|uniref:uncharacterized protein LOC125811352 n=1 Tax=Solanum verrucosum TaxID=315347 RepID=UPI0020D101B9|nr:uncharacterized protein LOC125811352 [Solanum verrucosum]
MAKAYRKEDFDKLMTKVVKVDHRVKDYLEDVGYEKWSRVHSPVNRGRMMTSNITECINGYPVEARQLPILVFLERLEFYLVLETVVPSSEYIFSVYKARRRYIVCLERKPDALAKTSEIAMVPMPDKEDLSVPDYVLDEIMLPPRYKDWLDNQRNEEKKMQMRR